MHTVDLSQGYSAQRHKPVSTWLPGLYPGTVGGIVGDSGVGKSWLALLLLHDWALGAQLTHLPITRQGRAGLLSLEDGEDLLQERLAVIGQQLTPAQIHDAPTRITCWDAAGDGMEPWPQRVQTVAQCARAVDILVIDHLRRLHPCDENSNTEMAQVVGDLQVIAVRTQTTILTIHHTATQPVGVPTSGRDYSVRGRGAAVIRNTWRWCATLQAETPAVVRMDITQARRGIATPVELGRFIYGPDGILSITKPGDAPSQSPEHLPEIIPFDHRL